MTFPQIEVGGEEWGRKGKMEVAVCIWREEKTTWRWRKRKGVSKRASTDAAALNHVHG
jgi:hypothetical protein